MPLIGFARVSNEDQTPLPRERHWTQSRMLRTVNAYVRDGFLPETMLVRAGRREMDDRLPARSRAQSRHHPSG